jgi:hypothetical protein
MMADPTTQDFLNTWLAIKDAVEAQNNLEVYGATVANRPAASSVPVGCMFMAVDTGNIWQSDGTNWVVRT